MTSQEGARWGWNAYWRKRPAFAVNLLCEGTGGDGSIIRSLMHTVWSLTWLARHTERRRRFQGQHLSNLLIHWPFKARSRRECELLSKHPSHTLPLRYAATENASPHLVHNESPCSYHPTSTSKSMEPIGLANHYPNTGYI